jgi:hypothetical protein
MVRSGFLDIYPVLSQSRRKSRRLLQLGVLRFGFLQDGDVGVGVFPQREEILIYKDAGVTLRKRILNDSSPSGNRGLGPGGFLSRLRTS